MRGKVRVPEIPRRGEGVAIWEQEIKLNFVKVGRGVGWTRQRNDVTAFSLSLSLSLSYLCSFDPGIFGRMKFGFEVNPLVRNQSRPHRITRVATENGFRDFKRVVELRFTEGNRTGEKGKGIWKMLDTLHTHGTNVYREIFRPPPPDKGEFHPRLSFGANATFHDENSIFQEIDVGNYFFSPSLFLSLSISLLTRMGILFWARERVCLDEIGNRLWNRIFIVGI